MQWLLWIIIKLSGSDTAKGLDVGGTADAQKEPNRFRNYPKIQNVKDNFDYIFGGICTLRQSYKVL